MKTKRKPLILLVGKSGTGKNYLIECLNLDPVVSHTTRDIRQNEKDGREHCYHSKDYFEKEVHGKIPDDIIAYTYYNNNHYWVTINDLKDKDIYVIDPAGVRYFSIKRKDIEFNIVYLKSSIFKRIKNMISRGDTIKQIFQRLKTDYYEFRVFEKYQIYDKIIKL